jgi:hypothetical protein
MPNLVIYRLVCEHLVAGAPNKQVMPCAFCNWADRQIVGIVIKEWHAYCETVGCKFGRWCGLSEPLARQLRNKHNARNPGHLGVHRPDIRKDSLRVRDRMAANGFFAETETEKEETG